MDILSGKLDKRGKLIVPEDQAYIKFDVGLAGEAPHSAIWLSETDDRFVIGIEPLSYHWEMLRQYEVSSGIRDYPENYPILQLEEGVVKLNRENISEIGDRFCGLQCAVDNVEEISEMDFYMMDPTDGASGSSSLLKPTEKHPRFIEKVVKTPVVSLEMILDHVDWERFPFIEHIKTDCEGKDFDVVNSIGKYLDRIVFITSEWSVNNEGHWEGQNNNVDFTHFMIHNNFHVTGYKGCQDVLFINKNYLDEIINLKLNSKMLGL